MGNRIFESNSFACPNFNKCEEFVHSRMNKWFFYYRYLNMKIEDIQYFKTNDSGGVDVYVVISYDEDQD